MTERFLRRRALAWAAGLAIVGVLAAGCGDDSEVAVPAPVANPDPAGGGSSVASWLTWLAASGAAAALLLALVGAGLVVRARRRQGLR